MKRVKATLTIAAISVLAMAAFGAASASAGTVLCAEMENPCQQSNIQPAETDFRAGNIYTPSFTIGNVLKCEHNVLTATSTMRNGNPLPAEFDGFVIPSFCKVPSAGWSECTNVTMNSPPTNIKSTGGESGVVEIGSTSQPLTISWLCTSSLGTANCVYKATGTVTLKVSEWTEATITAPLSKVSGNFLPCNNTAPNLVVKDVVSEPDAYISQASETVLCGTESVTVCPNDQIKPAGTRLGTGAYNGFVLSRTEASGNWADCEDSMTFDTTQESGAPLPATMDSAVFVASCLGPFGVSCSAMSWSNPPTVIEATGPNEGVVKIGTAAQPLTLTSTCTYVLNTSEQRTCTWSAKGPVELVVEEETAVVKSVPMVLTAGSKSYFICGSSGEAKLTIERYAGSTEGGSLFISRI